ncbi:MAG TPA: hypothetical protein VKU03_01720 [Roseiarcus sp.]|nr:hypothetical protein [Roseiarcus sp.]
MAKLSRRGVMALIAMGAILASSTGGAETPPPLPPNTHFKAIRVDVAPLLANSGEPTAGWMAQSLTGPLQAAFAAHLAPGDRAAPTLVVRIDNVFLGESGNGVAGFTGDVTARDNIQGAGVVVGPDGRTVAVYPLFSVLYNYTGGTNFEMGSYRRRIAELAQSFAQWLPGQMGL